jgi:hypothetical protein
MPQPPGYEPFTRLWRIEATWRGVSQDFKYYNWVYYEWFTNEESFNRKMDLFAQHPDYTVDGREVDWYNAKFNILAWFYQQMGPYRTSDGSYSR